MKTRLIPFDIEKAKAGAKVCTREGYEVTIFSFDCGDNNFPIVGAIHVGVGMHPIIHRLWSENGYASPAAIDESNEEDDLLIEEEVEVKTRLMTHQELSDWLRDCPDEHRECRFRDSDLVFTYFDYSDTEASTPVEKIFVRSNHGEWKIPVI